jgi:hypothetical protein
MMFGHVSEAEDYLKQHMTIEWSSLIEPPKDQPKNVFLESCFCAEGKFII